MDVIKATFSSVVFITSLPDVLEEQSILSIFCAQKDFNTMLLTVQ